MSKEPVLCHLHIQEDPPRDTHPFIHASIHPFSNHHFSCAQAVGGCPSCHRVMAALHPGQVASLLQGHIEMFLASGRKLEFLERTLAETGRCKFHTVIWT